MASMASVPNPRAVTGRMDATDLSQYLGQIVPYHFDRPFLILSYLISLVGAASTLQLINRRTSRKGLYNQYVRP